MIKMELKSMENYVDHQQRIIENLKDIIQDKENEIAKLWHENRRLKQELEGRKGEEC